MDTNLDMIAIKAAAKRELRGLDGIEGFGVGDHRLRVYVRDADAGRRLPSTFHGVDVECVVTGDIAARADSR
ncbi:MAG TPA: hypothetical protein VGH73_24655 [Thermoanaerobaculia bacterium]|jgi:hypothetical protein